MAKFCTSLSCMDGRVQLPIIHWLKEKHGATYVDTITEPGMDKAFASKEKMDELKSKVSISVNAHGSRLILISGHHDCAGNPVSKQDHIEHIKKTMAEVKAWGLPVTVLGAWINEDWQLEEVS